MSIGEAVRRARVRNARRVIDRDSGWSWESPRLLCTTSRRFRDLDRLEGFCRELEKISPFAVADSSNEPAAGDSLAERARSLARRAPGPKVLNFSWPQTGMVNFAAPGSGDTEITTIVGDRGFVERVRELTEKYTVPYSLAEMRAGIALVEPIGRDEADKEDRARRDARALDWRRAWIGAVAGIVGGLLSGLAGRFLGLG